jgi:polysaccharide export outer membrane protein
VSHRVRNSRLRRDAAIVVLLGCICASGCQYTPAPPPGTLPTYRTSAPELPEYRVGAPDQLVIRVFPEPIIERSVTVRPDGRISFDLIGDVQAAGRTPDEISAEIQKRIGRFKRDARATVEVGASRSDAITIFGEVNSPGSFPLTRQTRISEALGLRGGVNFFAAKGSIRLIRTDGTKTTVTEVNLREIEHGDLESDLLVAGGDIIVVPPHALARVGQFLQTLFFPFQPLLGSGMTAFRTAAAF